jgi:hypothetical protein
MTVNSKNGQCTIFHHLFCTIPICENQSAITFEIFYIHSTTHVDNTIVLLVLCSDDPMLRRLN